MTRQPHFVLPGNANLGGSGVRRRGNISHGQAETRKKSFARIIPDEKIPNARGRRRAGAWSARDRPTRPTAASDRRSPPLQKHLDGRTDDDFVVRGQFAQPAPTRCYFSGSRWSSRQAQRLVSTKTRTFSRPVSGLVLRCLRLGPGARATRRGSSAPRCGKQCRRPPHPAHPEPRSADVCCRHSASGSRGFPQTRDTCSTDFGPREKCGLALAFEQFHAKAHLFSAAIFATYAR